MPAIVVHQKAPVVVKATDNRLAIQAKAQPVNVGIVPPAHVGIETHGKRVIVVHVGRPGPEGPAGLPGADGGLNSLVLNITHSALPGPVSIGKAISKRKVLDVIVFVKEAFGAGVTMTIGTEASQAILLTESENSLQDIGMYEKTANYEYAGIPEFKAFFFGGPSLVAGRAEITISFI